MPNKPKPIPKLSAKRKAAFLRQVLKGPGENDCHLWSAPGPTFFVDGRMIPVQRVAYLIHHGSLPINEATKELASVFRTCGNSQCVRPEHLQPNSRTRPTLPAESLRDIERIRRAESHPLARLTEAKVGEIRKRYASGTTTIHKLAVEFEVGRTTINNILLGRTWRSVPMPAVSPAAA